MPSTDPVPQNTNQYLKEYQLADLFSTWRHINSHQGSSLTRATCHFFEEIEFLRYYAKFVAVKSTSVRFILWEFVNVRINFRGWGKQHSGWKINIWPVEAHGPVPCQTFSGSGARRKSSGQDEDRAKAQNPIIFSSFYYVNQNKDVLYISKVFSCCGKQFKKIVSVDLISPFWECQISFNLNIYWPQIFW